MSISNEHKSTDSKVILHSMKKIEVIVTGENESLISNMLNDANISGFTLLRNVSGKGHHGFHEGLVWQQPLVAGDTLLGAFDG